MNDIRAMGAGATFEEVSKSDLTKFVVDLPSLSAQRRLVSDLRARLAATSDARWAATSRREPASALRARAYDLAFNNDLPFTVLSGRDEAPSDWAWHTLTEIARLETGHTPVARDPTGGTATSRGSVSQTSGG
jgi:hypothetical protein